MWDLVGNPEDRFSQNEAQIGMVRRIFYFDISFYMGVVWELNGHRENTLEIP